MEIFLEMLLTADEVKRQHLMVVKV